MKTKTTKTTDKGASAFPLFATGVAKTATTSANTNFYFTTTTTTTTHTTDFLFLATKKNSFIK